MSEALDKAIEIINGVHECPFVYNGTEMDCGCENCTEQEPTTEQELKCWKDYLIGNKPTERSEG